VEQVNRLVVGHYRHISTADENDVLILTLKINQVRDYVVAEELRYELLHAVRRVNAQKIVVDLRNLTFMTSLACVAFLGLKAGLREHGGRLILCNLSEFIRKVFSAKRLLSPSPHTGSVAFETAGSLHDAVRKFDED
jgi:anti-anti-sigma factor